MITLSVQTGGRHSYNIRGEIITVNFNRVANTNNKLIILIGNKQNNKFTRCK